MTRQAEFGNAAQTAVHLLGATAGIWLLARVQALAGLSLTRQPEWAALGAFALLGTAIAAWTAEDDQWRWRWIAVQYAPASSCWPAACPGRPGTGRLCLVAGGLRAGRRAAGRGADGAQVDGAGVCRRSSARSCCGALPGTVGFLARSALIFPHRADNRPRPVCRSRGERDSAGRRALGVGATRRGHPTQSKRGRRCRRPRARTAPWHDWPPRRCFWRRRRSSGACFPNDLRRSAGSALPDGATTLAQVIAKWRGARCGSAS